MGMAASQARLLTITARIHDVEYEAQSIQNAKIQLATQEDAVYREYNEALDATTMTLMTLDGAGNKNLVAATFNNLCSRDRALAANGSTFALRTKDGKLIVEDDIANAYNGHENDFDSPYDFALTMLDSNYIVNLKDYEEEVYSENNDDKDSGLTKLHEKLEELVGNNDIYDRDSIDIEDEESIKEYDETMKKYQAALYQRHAGEIFKKTTGQDSTFDVEEDFDSDLFNYFVEIYQQIKACGGCVSIDFYNGSLTNNSAANNSEWLQAMVQSGQISIDTVIKDNKTGDISLSATSPSSDSVISYTQTSTIDKTALAKAEAKYEHDMKLIDKKDKQFDLSLSKLETERTALTTEYDSIKKVISDNIDRTFGIFS